MVTRVLAGFLAIVFLLICDVSSLAAEEKRPLSVRKAIAKAEESMTLSQASAGNACGGELSFAFDWTGFSNDHLKQKRPASYCESAFFAIRQICGEDMGPQAVGESINGVVCGYSDDRLVSLDDGILRFDLNFTDGNNQSFIYEFLLDAL